MGHGIDLALSTLQLGLAIASVAVWLTIFERRRRRIPLVPAEPRQNVPWNGADVLFLAIAAFVIELAAQSIVNDRTPPEPVTAAASQEAIARSTGVEVSLANVVSVAVSRMVWIALAIFVLSTGRGATLAEMGFDTSREPSDLRLAGFLFLAAVLPVYGTQLLLNIALGLESDHPLVKLVEEERSLGVLAIVTLVAVVAAPLVEEFLFRVLLQGWLEKRQVAAAETVEGERPLPGYAPIVISALFFGLLHVGHGADPIPLFLLGLFLGYAYRQTHRIIAPLAMHMMVNGLAMAELWAIYLRGGK